MQQRIEPRYLKLERRALDGELNRWGNWIEKHSDFQGYPGMNIIVGYLMGRGGGTAGHRILCLEMPVDVYAVHARVLTLMPELQEAVWIWFVTRVRPDGTLWSIEDRCERIGIGERTLRRRLAQARRKLMGLPEEPCMADQCQVDSVAS